MTSSVTPVSKSTMASIAPHAIAGSGSPTQKGGLSRVTSSVPAHFSKAPSQTINAHTAQAIKALTGLSAQKARHIPTQSIARSGSHFLKQLRRSLSTLKKHSMSLKTLIYTIQYGIKLSFSGPLPSVKRLLLGSTKKHRKPSLDPEWLFFGLLSGQSIISTQLNRLTNTLSDYYHRLTRLVKQKRKQLIETLSAPLSYLKKQLHSLKNAFKAIHQKFRALHKTHQALDHHLKAFLMASKLDSLTKKQPLSHGKNDKKVAAIIDRISAKTSSKQSSKSREPHQQPALYNALSSGNIRMIVFLYLTMEHQSVRTGVQASVYRFRKLTTLINDLTGDMTNMIEEYQKILHEWSLPIELTVSNPRYIEYVENQSEDGAIDPLNLKRAQRNLQMAMELREDPELVQKLQQAQVNPDAALSFVSLMDRSDTIASKMMAVKTELQDLIQHHQSLDLSLWQDTLAILPDLLSSSIHSGSIKTLRKLTHTLTQEQDALLKELDNALPLLTDITQTPLSHPDALNEQLKSFLESLDLSPAMTSLYDLEHKRREIAALLSPSLATN